MTKHKVLPTGMKARVYPILERAVEEGLNNGWHRAHKYTEFPENEKLKEDLVHGVMGAICEVFKFDDDDEEENE